MLIINCKSACLDLVFRSPLRKANALSLPLFLSITALCLQMSATTLPYKSFDDLMKEADGVVSGRVAAVESQYNATKEIYTFVTFDQLEVLSGSYQESTLTLRFKGGQIENDISHIVGSPEFKVQDRVVLFVQGNGRYMVPLVGWTQGMFRIVPDAATQQDVVQDSVGNRVLALQNGQVLKDMMFQPEAQIINQQGGFTTANSQNQGDGGAPDSTAPTGATVLAGAQPNVLRSLPTMASRSFFDSVRKSAALRQSKNQLTNVRLMDFSVASANTDAAVGPKSSAVNAAVQQTPILPARKPVMHGEDQQ